MLVDVREPGEREVVTIPGSVWVPLAKVREAATGQGRFEEIAGLAGIPAGATVYVYCKSGSRSGQAVDLLRSGGLDAVDVQEASSLGCARSTPGCRPTDIAARSTHDRLARRAARMPAAPVVGRPTRHVTTSGCRWPVVES